MRKIEQGEHVFVAGRTGSGKTFLVKKYLENAKYKVFVLDLKKTLDWQGIPDRNIAYVNKLENIRKTGKRKTVYQPIWEEINPETIDEFFKLIYKEEDCIVWVDELMAIGNAVKFPDWYKACLTRGRELGISVWSCTQRPATIPIISISEASHLFIFDLNMKKDRQRIAEIAGHGAFMQRPGKFVFWYFDTRKTAEPIRAKLVEKGDGNG